MFLKMMLIRKAASSKIVPRLKVKTFFFLVCLNIFLSHSQESGIGDNFNIKFFAFILGRYGGLQLCYYGWPPIDQFKGDKSHSEAP